MRRPAWCQRKRLNVGGMDPKVLFEVTHQWFLLYEQRAGGSSNAHQGATNCSVSGIRVTGKSGLGCLRVGALALRWLLWQQQQWCQSFRWGQIYMQIQDWGRVSTLTCTPTLPSSPTCPATFNSLCTQFTPPTPYRTCSGLLSSLCPALHILHSWNPGTPT